MTTFALIHGAWHGPWCWERLTPELESRGHRVVGVDVRFDDPAATFDDHAATVVAALGAEHGDVVAVGHSLGGFVLPWVAAQRSLRRLVYLCGVLAEPGRSLAESDREHRILAPGYPAGLAGVDGGTRWVDTGLARSLFYSDCDDQIAAAAVVRLRVQARGLMTQPCPLDYRPPVPSTAIVCAEDPMVDPGWQRRVADEWTGAHLVELPGGHSPFFSRPAELADVLDGLA